MHIENIEPSLHYLNENNVPYKEYIVYDQLSNMSKKVNKKKERKVIKTKSKTFIGGYKYE